MRLIYSENINPRVAVAVARYLNSPLDYIRADSRNPDLVAEVERSNPNGLYPILIENDSTALWETDAIACRLSQIAGSDFLAQRRRATQYDPLDFMGKQPLESRGRYRHVGACYQTTLWHGRC